MYVRKIAAIIFLFFLTACSAEIFDETEALLRLQQEGTLIEVTMTEIQTITPQLVQVTTGDLEGVWDFAVVNVHYPNMVHLSFENSIIPNHSEGMMVIRSEDAFILDFAGGHTFTASLDALALEFIEEGTFIASLQPEENALTLIRQRELQMEIERFNTATTNEDGRRRALIETLRDEVAFTENWEMAALELEREEIAYELFLLDSTRRRVELNEELERLTLLIEGERLYAPVSGIVAYAVDLMSNWSSNLDRLMVIVDDSDVQFRIRVNSSFFRFGDVFTVRDVIAGGVSFDVRVANDPLVRPVTPGSEHEFILVPADSVAFAAELEQHGLTNWDLRNISLRSNASILYARDAVLVNRQAIQTEFQSSYVFLYEDGEISRRYVTVGTAREYVEILAGLEPGQWVVIP